VARARDRLSAARPALDAAFRQGFARVELEVRADNARAIALYDKIGFVRKGLLRDSFFIDGEYFNAIAMAIIRRPYVATGSDMPLPAVVFGPVIANGSFTSTPVVRCAPKKRPFRDGLGNGARELAPVAMAFDLTISAPMHLRSSARSCDTVPDDVSAFDIFRW